MKYLMEGVSKLINIHSLDLDLSDNRLGDSGDNATYLVDGI